MRNLAGDDAREIVPRLLATDGRKHMWRYARAFLYMGVIAATTALSAYLMKHVVDRIFVDGDYAAVWFLGFSLDGTFHDQGTRDATGRW